MSLTVLGTVIAVVFGATSLPLVQGQSEKVELRLKLSRGEALAYDLASMEQTRITGPGFSRGTESTVQALEMHRVLAVGPEGVMTVEVFQDSMKVTTAGKTEESWRIPLIIRVHPTGLVVERVFGVYDEPDEFPIPPPPGPIGVGDTWQREASVGVDLEGTITRTYTLASIDRSGGETTARIQVRVEGMVRGTPVVRGIQGRVSGKAQGTGEIVWSLDRGRLLKETDAVAIEVDAESIVEGQSVKVKVTINLSERRELMAQPPPPVIPSAQALIVPGKSLGDLSLGLSMSELTARFGQPAPEPELGLRSRRLRWTTGLVVHVHPDDASRALGLEITDRQYRTDKGIGFRSSEGAALLAYGLDPPKVELTSVRLGGYHALVYDNLGVAFGIRSDNFGTLLGRAHPPLGTVEFVIVFIPGTASSIFSL